MSPRAIAEVISRLEVSESIRLAIAFAFADAMANGNFDRQTFVGLATDVIDWQDPSAIYLDGEALEET